MWAVVLVFLNIPLRSSQYIGFLFYNVSGIEEWKVLSTLWYRPVIHLVDFLLRYAYYETGKIIIYNELRTAVQWNNYWQPKTCKHAKENEITILRRFSWKCSSIYCAHTIDTRQRHWELKSSGSVPFNRRNVSGNTELPIGTR